MREVILSVDGALALQLRIPRSVELPLCGDLSDRGVERLSVPVVDVPRPLPVFVEPPRTVAPAPAAPTPPKGITISETAALITDKTTGKYPHKDSFRDELLRALDFAAEVWGAETSWETIDEAHWTKLLRLRCEQLVAKDCKAVRATEITVSRLVTAAGWLRDTKRIGRDAAIAPRNWKKEIGKYWKGLTGSDRDQQPDQPRHTLEELRRILASSDFDPRLFLLLHIGIGLRPGQVARARRSDLKLPEIVEERAEDGTDLTDYGTFEVHGAGKKGGVTVDLTRGQREKIDAALTGDGYLASIEARYQAKDVTDYRLFPTGYVVGRVGLLRGKPTKLSLAAGADFTKNVSASWIRKGWRTAEERAGVPHIDGRSTYSQRRIGVDVADDMEVSPSVLENVGGWSDTKIPQAIYRDRQNKVGRRGARGVRARVLGESEATLEQRGDNDLFTNHLRG